MNLTHRVAKSNLCISQANERIRNDIRVHARHRYQWQNGGPHLDRLISLCASILKIFSCVLTEPFHLRKKGDEGQMSDS